MPQPSDSNETIAIPPSRTASSWTASEGSRFLPGAVIAQRYRIIALLGRGGMGEVYRADDLSLGQQVALKFLPESVAANPDVVDRFRNEVRVARQVSHPNVCRVYDLGELEGHLFLSMEYVDGEDLASLLRRIGRLPVDKALEIARRLCAGLAAAHEKGILHRDLKPSNVMLDGRGQVLLTDFGLAGLADQISGAEVRNGTPAYMAPEQLADKEVTIRSDIYSLGLVLYEIFTGKRPYDAGSAADLVRVQTETTPQNPSTLVRDIDPTVERVILRCLQPDPARRPPSALSVAAAMPGGDPLAAALAAGETPTPEMVAAAGEGSGLAPRVAIPVLLAILAGIVIVAIVRHPADGVDRIHPPFSPDVLSQKARDVIQRLGYGGHSTDDAYAFEWNRSVLNYAQSHDKPFPQWKEVLAQRPPALYFWYRASDYPLTAYAFHNDALTPDLVDENDPPFDLSNMVKLRLDPQGRLLRFEATPPQLLEPVNQSPAVDWTALFVAAELDPAKLSAAEPLWTWQATSDTQAAWTGTWPGTERPLRVEAASLRGKPVAFALMGPWNNAFRMPPPEPPASQQAREIMLIILGVVLCIAAPLFARANLRQGRGDQRGALRLAVFIFAVQMAIWLCQAHFAASIATWAMFFVAVCTSLFYGAVVWAIYLALEPYVRRRWPHTLISWTSLLTGRVRDPVVGRDVLFGVALGVSWEALQQAFDYAALGSHMFPRLSHTSLLLGVRSTAGELLSRIPGSVRTTLIFFFVLFFLRVLLRNQWLAGAVFVLLWSSLSFVQSNHPWIDGTEAVLIYGLVAVGVVRFGLLAIGVGVFVDGLIGSISYTLHTSAWYFPNAAFVLAGVVTIAAWGFYTATAGQRMWKADLLE